MLDVIDFDEKSVASYTRQELIAIRNKIEMKKSILNEECAAETIEVMKEKNFDIYSYRGNKKLKKISQKYAPLFSGADYLLDIIKVELEKRDKYDEELKYSGKSLASKQPKMSTDEFLKKEEEKTWVHRSKIE